MVAGTGFHGSGFWRFGVSGTGLLVQVFPYRGFWRFGVSSSWFGVMQVRGFGYGVSVSGFRVRGSGYGVSRFGFFEVRGSGTWFRVWGSPFEVSGSGFWRFGYGFSCSLFRVFDVRGCGYRVHGSGF